jgi:hypothetical protein
MDPNLPEKKKGLGLLAWLGIGCGGIIVLCIIGVVAFTAFFGKDLKQWAEEAQTNPTRATAITMTKVPGLEMVAEDNVNKRYTIREKKTGALTTIYWDEKSKSPQTIQGDFSAIPKDVSEAAPPATPAVQ